MGLIELHKRRLNQTEKWYIVAATNSTNSAMAFDRLRMSNNSGIEVGIIPPTTTTTQSTLGLDALGDYFTIPKGIVEQIQPFHAGGGWTSTPDEHDFSFDCSNFDYSTSAGNTATIVIRGQKISSIVWQLYAYPTGYSATRNKNAQLVVLDYSTMRTGNVSGQIARLRLTNQSGCFPYEYFLTGQSAPIRAKEVRMEGTGGSAMDFMFQQLVDGGEVGGTLSYTANDRPGNQIAENNYDTLISRNWSITGGRPSA